VVYLTVVTNSIFLGEFELEQENTKENTLAYLQQEKKQRRLSMPLSPTAEQQEILELATKTNENIIISALAGCAKTSTLEMIANAIRNQPILYVVFNRRNAEEAKGRLPSHVEVKTLNSLGHRVWSETCGRRLVVRSTKMADLWRAWADSLPKLQKDRAWDERDEVMDLLRQAKRDGYVPPGASKLAKWQWCENGVSDDWWLDKDYDEAGNRMALVDRFLEESIIQAYKGTIDYDDQLYMPVCFSGTWPKFPLVLVDEAQDLSPINHQMLKGLYHKRLIVVGDPWQSIYAFRGSVFNGMDALKARYAMREMTLSVTFRVPKAGVLRQQHRVPRYAWPDWLDWPSGRVETLETWDATSLPNTCAILCRNNAPLFTCALRLLSRGRKIRLVGMDIGPNLLRILKKLGPPTATNLPGLIEAWRGTERSRVKNAERVDDKAECLHALCEGRATLQDAIVWTENLFAQQGDIQLLSIHKAKGLEWNVVYHLDSWRIPSRYAISDEELEQEKNLRYVCETRFKEELYLCNLEDLQ
jgi:DNA helicase II / ATP-dependent DNA helicase PcrA